MDQYTAINNQIIEIKQKLLDAGISEEDSVKILKDLDQTIFRLMTRDIMQQLSPSEIDDITKSSEDDTVVAKKISEHLGISDQEITVYYADRLKEYLTKLPDNLPSIKEKLEQQKKNDAPTSE